MADESQCAALGMPKQAVIFEVTDNGHIQDVIAVIVQMHLFFEFFIMGFNINRMIIAKSVILHTND